jgi:hypothetical protein
MCNFDRSTGQARDDGSHPKVNTKLKMKQRESFVPFNLTSQEHMVRSSLG